MTVTGRQGKDIKNSIKNIFTDINIKPGKRVCIKPNWCGRYPVVPGENTSPEVLSALVEYLLEQGCKVSLIHGALLGSGSDQVPFEKTIEWAGIEDGIFDSLNIVNLDTLYSEEVSCNGFKFHLPLEYFTNEVETYINLAKIKSHMETTVSFSLKNLMGLASKGDRVNMHRTNLEENIAKLALIMQPDLSILEGYPAMQGNGPHHGDSIKLNMILAGDNMVELDSFACHLLGYNPEDVPHLCYARDLGAGYLINEKDITKYSGLSVSDFKPAEKVYKFGFKVYAYPTKSCSRCINAVWQAGKSFKSHPIKYRRFMWKAFFSRNNIRIVFGKDDQIELDERDKMIFIGKCTKNLAQKYDKEFLEACPPKTNEVIDYIISII